MTSLLGFISTLFVATKVVSEALEKPAPKGTRFDWDAYYKDIENGMDFKTRLRKRQKGGYNTTEPAVPVPDHPTEDIVDIARYAYDLKTQGAHYVELGRSIGSYREVKAPETYMKKD